MREGKNARFVTGGERFVGCGFFGCQGNVGLVIFHLSFGGLGLEDFIGFFFIGFYYFFVLTALNPLMTGHTKVHERKGRNSVSNHQGEGGFVCMRALVRGLSLFPNALLALVLAARVL
jgi:hypothetical protein